MSNLIFPQTIGLKIERTKTPEWKTIIHRAVSGKETRTSLMSYPLWNFSVSYEFLRDEGLTNEFKNLVGFFNNMKGSYDTFLYLDPYDNIATNQAFAVGNGVDKVFQLTREIGTFVEPIVSVNGSPDIFINGTLQTSGYIIADGFVTFTSAPSNGAVMTWSGSFFYRCRFLNDMLEFKQFMYDLWESSKVEFVSVK
jgi:uncharacterized protein (TIGR02217 family)